MSEATHYSKFAVLYVDDEEQAVVAFDPRVRLPGLSVAVLRRDAHEHPRSHRHAGCQNGNNKQKRGDETTPPILLTVFGRPQSRGDTRHYS